MRIQRERQLTALLKIFSVSLFQFSIIGDSSGTTLLCPLRNRMVKSFPSLYPSNQVFIPKPLKLNSHKHNLPTLLQYLCLLFVLGITEEVSFGFLPPCLSPNISQLRTGMPHAKFNRTSIPNEDRTRATPTTPGFAKGYAKVFPPANFTRVPSSLRGVSTQPVFSSSKIPHRPPFWPPVAGLPFSGGLL